LKLKLSQFRSNKAELIRSINKHGIESLSYFCACTGLPVAAACVFVKEDLSQFTEEMDRKLEALREFYGYTEIEE
jgi:hypothetical protein